MQVPNINSIFKNLNERIMDNSVRSDLTKLDIDIKSNYFFFPFIIKTGLVNITDKGFQPNNGVPQNFTQMSQIFTGKEGIIAQWKNAIKIRSRAIPDIWNYDFFQNNKDWFTYSIDDFKKSLTDKVSYLYITSTEKNYLWDATKQVFINKDNPDNNYPVNDIWEKNCNHSLWSNPNPGIILNNKGMSKIIAIINLYRSRICRFVNFAFCCFFIK
ncbi:hypothetical protein M1771_02835 [Spiroplasma citri]|uniref:Adhesin P123 n=1 Tax=Spiroplasma citri TaxID=2133 RepID=A0AAX3T0H2_SPICI|nr:hypothetical protein [Spiroplasma citri]WFG96966.1 hypothetical protein M0C40_02840 [Spiroplasma citri]WFH00865.1 hypothetical protein M1771_02835 [Spiroplasma citri]